LMIIGHKDRRDDWSPLRSHAQCINTHEGHDSSCLDGYELVISAACQVV
jgi:hypothetical protein